MQQRIALALDWTGRVAQQATSARRGTGYHPDAMGMPMLNGRLGANCPFRTAIALSERPKPRRTPTKASFTDITAYVKMSYLRHQLRTN